MPLSEPPERAAETIGRTGPMERPIEPSPVRIRPGRLRQKTRELAGNSTPTRASRAESLQARTQWRSRQSRANPSPAARVPTQQRRYREIYRTRADPRGSCRCVKPAVDRVERISLDPGTGNRGLGSGQLLAQAGMNTETEKLWFWAPCRCESLGKAEPGHDISAGESRGSARLNPHGLEQP
jgi:hypothetical protein